MPDARPAHQLTPEENERIFRTDILPDYLPSGMGGAGNPVLIVLGGQPGAGKTGLLTASLAELEPSGPAIRIVGDDLRSYHPSFMLLQRQDPETASHFTQRDAGLWTEKLLTAATVARVHVVFETTMRTPDNVERIVTAGRDAGYRIEARAVAVDPRISWQACHYRFEDMHIVGAAARMPPREVHDAAVTGLSASLARLEDERLADRIQVRIRSGAVVYDNDRQGNEWRQPARIAEVLEKERSQVLSRAEIQRFADEWSLVIARMGARHAGADRIAAVEIQAKDDLAHFLSRRRDADAVEATSRRRSVVESQPDKLKLFVELYDNAVRDAARRPIGNIEAHALGRLSQSYAALKLVEAARELGLLPEGGKIVATKALVQDKRAEREFPAAHRMPADLAVVAPDGRRQRLTDVFAVPLNRTAIDRDVLAPTGRLSRIANVADSWAEAAGMRVVLANAANAVASGRMSADGAMTRTLEPGYAKAIVAARRKLDRNFTMLERVAIGRALVDASGAPIRAASDELRLRTADIATRAHAKAMLGQALDETGRHSRLEPARRRVMDELVRGVAENERLLGGGHRIVREEKHTPANGVLVPGRRVPDLTEAEIAQRLEKSTRLTGKRAEIEHLSRLVFGDPVAISSTVRAIGDARTGAAAGQDVRDGRLGPLAGEGGGWLRSDSPDRQTARANLPKLAAALGDYGQAIDFERGQVVTRYAEEQRRQQVAVPRPSVALTSVLTARPEEQVQRLNSAPDLRRELDDLAIAIKRRLTSEDNTALKGGDIERVAKSLGVPAERIVALRQIQDLAAASQQNRQVYVRDLARQQNASPVIKR